MDRKQIEFLVKLRDGAQMIADSTNEFLESLVPSETQEERTAVIETTFTTLKFEPQKGEKLGAYETAYKKSNIPDKFQCAFNILSKSNAIISNRYYGTRYACGYWIYNDRIFRQKLKGATPQ